MSAAGGMLKVRLVLRQSLQLLCAVAVGVVIGYILIIGYLCALSGYHGGSADPRCAAGNWTGYVEVHQLNHPEPERVTCVYRPDAGGVP